MPVAGLVTLPFDTLDVVPFTFVAVVRFIVPLPEDDTLPLLLLLFAGVETVEELLLTLLLTLVPPLTAPLLPLAASL